MAIDGIQSFDPRIDRLVKPQEEQGAPKTGNAAGGPSFGEALEGALRSTADGLSRADAAAKAYISGEGGDLHNVMLEMERADVQFKTMLQVRNKLVEAYREVMRMQV
jgi:flagellar hook-basal body complex protein FliE